MPTASSSTNPATPRITGVNQDRPPYGSSSRAGSSSHARGSDDSMVVVVRAGAGTGGEG